MYKKKFTLWNLSNIKSQLQEKNNVRKIYTPFKNKM